MTRFLLDTNIISDAVKKQPSENLSEWLAGQKDDDLFVSSMTIGEIQSGILVLPLGKHRHTLEEWFEGSQGPQALFAGRILPFDDKAGLVWARLMAEGKTLGRERSAVDMIIAAVSEVHGCIVVTNDKKDFWGLKVFNPMQELASDGVQ